MAKKGKGILKRVGTALVIGYFTFAIGFLSFYAGAAIKSGLSTKYKYNQPAIVQELLEDFDVSDNYLVKSEYGYYKRIEFNKNAPIYISFSKEYDNYPELKKIANDAIEYVFGIVNKINPDYHYKIVSEAERGLNCAIGRSSIKFVNESIASEGLGFVTGTEKESFNFYDITKRDANYSSTKITIDFKYFSEKINYKQCFYTFAHELMHVFGFDDIYNNYSHNGVYGTDAGSVRRRRGDTFMDTLFGPNYLIITPKDFASLCALYMPKLDGVSDEEYKSKMDNLIKEYTKEYYEKYEAACIEMLKGSNLIEVENLQRPDNLSSFKALIIDYFLGTSKCEYNYNITITNGNRYKIEIVDESNRVLASCNGDVIKTDKFLVFKDCYFKNGIMPNNSLYGCDDGYIQDIAVYDDGARLGMILLGENRRMTGCGAKYTEANSETGEENTL